jgi:hypothetical protein
MAQREVTPSDRSSARAARDKLFTLASKYNDYLELIRFVRKALSSLGPFGPPISTDELLASVGHKLVQLLKDDEAGWHNAACRMDQIALDKGIDLAADFETPERFSHSLIEAMRFHTDFQQLFPKGVGDLARFEVAEELFLELIPRSESDYSAFEPERSGALRLFPYMKRILRAVALRK